MQHLENIEGITEKYSLRSNRKDVACVKQQIYYKFEEKGKIDSIQNRVPVKLKPNLFERKLISSNCYSLLEDHRLFLITFKAASGGGGEGT